MNPPSLVHLFQESLNIFLEVGICGTRDNFWVFVYKALEIDIVLSDVIHDNHEKATRKPLYGVKFGSISYCSANSMNFLAVLMGKFDTQGSTTSSGIKMTEENKVVVGFQLCSVHESVRRGAGGRKRSWIRIHRVAQ
jgi:hypothetical protein